MSFTATHYGANAERLVRLLRQRTDLDSPPLRNLSDLEYRLTRNPGFPSGLAQIDVVEWTVLQASLLAPPGASFVDLAQLIGTPVFADDVATAASRLEDLGLAVVVNGSVQTDPMLRPFVAYPGALGPPLRELVSALSVASLRAVLLRYGTVGPVGPKHVLVDQLCAVLQDDDQLTKAYEALPERAHALLASMTSQMPVVQVDDPWWQLTEKPATPSGHLRAWGLALPTQQYRIALPREISLRRRGGRYFTLPRRPDPATHAAGASVPDPGGTSREAVGVVARMMGDCERLLAAIGAEPVQALQTGGIGTSQLKRLGKLLGMEATRIADLLDVLAIVGLVSSVEPPTRGRSKPAPPTYGAIEGYRLWSEIGLARRWCDVVQSWYFSRLFLGLGGRAEGDRSPEPALKWTLGEPVMAVRAGMIDMLAGGFPTASPAAVIEWCAWHRPLAGSGEYDTGSLMVRETGFLQLLGVLVGERSFPVAIDVLQRISDHTFSPLTVSDDDETLVAVSAWLNDTSSVVKVQGDMTIVVTGQPSAALSTELALIADVVSHGAATVYRLTESSLHRAFESGWTAAQVIDLLGEHAAAPVPSSVGTLVEDAERRFGRVQVAKASSVVVVADAIAAAELASSRSPKVRALRLMRVAPTVFVSDTAHAKVLVALKDAGIAASAMVDSGGGQSAVGEGPSGSSGTWQPASRMYQFHRQIGPGRRAPAEAAEAILRPAPSPSPSPIRIKPPSASTEEDDDMPGVGDSVQVLHFAGKKPRVDFGTVITVSEYELVLLRPNGTQLTLDRDDVLSWAYDDDLFDD